MARRLSLEDVEGRFLRRYESEALMSSMRLELRLLEQADGD